MDIVGPRTMEFCRRWGIADWVRCTLPPRLPAGLHLRHRAQRLRAGASRFPDRLTKCPPQSHEKRERARGHVRPDPGSICATKFRTSRPVQHRAGRVRGGRAGGARLVRDTAAARPRSRRLYDRYRWRRQPRARDARHHGEGNPALTYTTNVMFRCADRRAARQGVGYPLHLHRAGGHLADHRGGQRRRSLPHVDRRLGRQARTQRGRHPRGAAARDGPGLRLRDPVGMRWVRRELVADSYGTERVFLAGDAAH